MLLVIQMEPYKEIILKFVLENEKKLNSSTIVISAKDIVENECYKTILKIKSILDNPFYSVVQKSFAVNQAISEFEKLGITMETK